MVELQNKLSEESKKADKMEFEYKRVKEKVDSLQKEKDVSCTSPPTHTGGLDQIRLDQTRLDQIRRDQP